MLRLSKALNYIQHLSLIVKKPVCAANISLHRWVCTDKLKIFLKGLKKKLIQGFTLLTLEFLSPTNTFEKQREDL